MRLFMDALVDEGFVVLGGPLADEHRVCSSSGPSRATQSNTFACDPLSETHLRVDTIDPWTIRPDGRRAELG
jgi:hypothetical protein